MSPSAVARLWLVLVLYSATAAAAVKGVQEVPRQFRGVWAASEAQCAAGGGEWWLVITAKRLSFYASEGVLKAAATDGDLELVVILESFGEEGVRWMNTVHFMLSEDRNRLTMDGLATRVRCAVDKKSKR
jgi:hypothetical protein